jgi:hypothetical protein
MTRQSREDYKGNTRLERCGHLGCRIQGSRSRERTGRLGVRRRAFLDGNVPRFQGTVALVDLAYTLLERTRIEVAVQRDLNYSYRLDEPDYLHTDVELSVTHRMGNAWDLRTSLGRFVLRFKSWARPWVFDSQGRELVSRCRIRPGRRISAGGADTIAPGSRRRWNMDSELLMRVSETNIERGDSRWES